MIKGILFDMDGVLVDNLDVHLEAFQIFSDRYGVTDWQSKIHAFFGLGNNEIMDRMFPAEIIKRVGYQALSDEKEAIYREIYAGKVESTPGLVDFLEEMRRKGIKCAVGSSGCKLNVDFILDTCGIRKYFDATVYSDMVTRCKPDPEIYMTAAKMLGLDTKDCVVFEDAKAGIIAARRAGVGKVVALATTLSREELQRDSDADLIIDDFRDILGEF